MRESNRPCYHRPNSILNHFQFLLPWPGYARSLNAFGRPAAHRRCSSVSAFTFQNVASKKSSLFACGPPSLDHSAGRTVFQPLLPAASSDQKKTKIAQADPTGHVNLTRLQHRTDLISTAPTIPRVHSHVPVYIVCKCAPICWPVTTLIIKKLHVKMCTCASCSH